MPVRPSRQALGASVGQTLFRGNTNAKAIAKKLGAIPQAKLQSALERRGLKDVSVKQLAKVLSGKDRAGLSHQELKQAVEAMQEVGAAKKAQSAGKMVMTASRQMQTDMAQSMVIKEQARKISTWSVEDETKSSSANDATARPDAKGVLERARGGAIRVDNRDNDHGGLLANMTIDPNAHLVATDQGGVRGLRDSIRAALGIAQKTIHAKSQAVRRAYRGKPGSDQMI